MLSGVVCVRNYRAYARHGFGSTMACAWLGWPYHVGHRRYAYRYPRRTQHWYSYEFSTVPWRYRGRDDHRWDEE
jgi:hypothetical protein